MSGDAKTPTMSIGIKLSAKRAAQVREVVRQTQIRADRAGLSITVTAASVIHEALLEWLNRQSNPKAKRRGRAK